ncbi:MAG: helix-turn-helix transcriptional regulator [Christensenellaceae bacterium]
METISSEMLRGHVDTVILLTLLNEHKHTNQIKEEIEARVGGEFKLKQGTFYSCLQRIVNQGYVVEYRSTSADGKRRKFYQLTEKGKAYINDNKDKWIFSRSVIDNLIQVPSEPYVEKSLDNEETSTNDRSIDQNIDYNAEIAATSNETAPAQEQAQPSSQIDFEPENHDFTINQTEYRYEKISPVSETAANDGNTKSKLKALEEYLNSQSTEITNEEDLNEPQKDVVKNEQNSFKTNQAYTVNKIDDDFKEAKNKDKSSDQKNLQVSLFDYLDNRNDTQSTNENESSSTVVHEHNLNETLRKNEENISKNLHNYVSEPDDFYDGEEQLSTNYRSALLKIFPKQNKVDNTGKYNASTYDETEAESALSFDEQEKDYTEKRKNNKFFRFDNVATKPSSPKKQESERDNASDRNDKKIPSNQQNTNSFDFSEIYALAQKEGFKVRTSSTSLKNDIGKIFINKLVLSSALTFYLILLIEIAVLALTTRSVANIDYRIYIAVAGIFAILPLGAFVGYIIDPKRKVDNLIPFKSVIEFSFIVMLNLIIIVFVAAIIKNVDFTNSKDLLLNIFYPLLAIINIPIYYFIKYLKLDNQKYYS